MLDVSFKSRKQVTECINNATVEFYKLGRKLCEEYRKVAQKRKEELDTIIDNMEKETSDLSEIEKARLLKSMEEFINSFRDNLINY